jgi:hypothetical protein
MLSNLGLGSGQYLDTARDLPKGGHDLAKRQSHIIGQSPAVSRSDLPVGGNTHQQLGRLNGKGQAQLLDLPRTSRKAPAKFPSAQERFVEI